MKKLPFTKTDIKNIMKSYPTPFHMYDEKAIRENAREFIQTFKWVNGGGFKNYFAVKATPNPYILQVLKEEGMGVDCSSMAELLMCEKVGFKGEDIMFTSNGTPAEEYMYAKKLGAIINLDDISHIPYLEKHVGIPSLICFRYNPGSLRENKGNTIIGNPEDAKYGLTREQLFEAYRIMRDKGVKRFGIHAMIASNELNKHAFVETAEMLFTLVKELSQRLEIQFEFINMAGGIGIPYRPEEKSVDLSYISRKIESLYTQILIKNGLVPPRLYMECGRFVTGPYGYLVTKVLHKKDIYKKYINVDASMADLMRPGMYGAYHHITVLGKEKERNTQTYDVVGSLCENNDKFAIDRKLPKINIDDVLVIHDTGAHGYSMGFNYNGKLRSAELLLKSDKTVVLIRRAESINDYFATLNFNGLKKGGI